MARPGRPGRRSPYRRENCDAALGGSHVVCGCLGEGRFRPPDASPDIGAFPESGPTGRARTDRQRWSPGAAPSRPPRPASVWTSPIPVVVVVVMMVVLRPGHPCPAVPVVAAVVVPLPRSIPLIPGYDHPAAAVPIVAVVPIPLPGMVVVVVVMMMVVLLLPVLRRLKTSRLLAHGVVCGQAGRRVRYWLEQVSIAERRRNRVRDGEARRRGPRQDGGHCGSRQPNALHLHGAIHPPGRPPPF